MFQFGRGRHALPPAFSQGMTAMRNDPRMAAFRQSPAGLALRQGMHQVFQPFRMIADAVRQRSPQAAQSLAYVLGNPQASQAYQNAAPQASFQGGIAAPQPLPPQFAPPAAQSTPPQANAAPPAAPQQLPPQGIASSPPPALPPQFAAPNAAGLSSAARPQFGNQAGIARLPFGGFGMRSNG